MSPASGARGPIRRGARCRLIAGAASAWSHGHKSVIVRTQCARGYPADRADCEICPAR